MHKLFFIKNNKDKKNKNRLSKHPRLSKLSCAILDVVTVFFALCITLLINPANALAYVDPSVMTYTIQALASVAVVLASVMGVAWRRLKKALTESLEINLNKNKSFESEVKLETCTLDDKAQIISYAEKEAIEKELEQKQENEISLEEKKAKRAKKYELKFSTRLILSAILFFFLGVSIIFFSPLSLISSQQNQFVINSVDLILPLLLVTVVIAVVLALLLSLLRGRAFYIISSIILAISIACVVQRLFLNFDLPALDGRMLDLGNFQTQVILTIIVWIIIIAIFLFIAIKKPKFVVMLGGLFVSILFLV
ncbi:MAG: hypothetical protein MJ231_08980, partial [bacterium]|nr:hypothetical protein [bacterium]